MCYIFMLSIVTSFEMNYFSSILTRHFRPSVMSLHLSAELRTVIRGSHQGKWNDLCDWLGNLNFVDFHRQNRLPYYFDMPQIGASIRCGMYTAEYTLLVPH